MEYIYCQRCGKELRPGTGDHYRYCASCLREFFGDVAYLDDKYPDNLLGANSVGPAWDAEEIPF